MKRLLSVGALSVLCMASPSARAQKPAPTALEKTTAQERFQRGVTLFDKAELKHDPALYEAALVEYQQAYTLWPTDKVLWNRALCELELKRYIDALKDFKTYDQHLNLSATPSLPHYAELKKYLAEANAATGHVTIQASPGAQIQVDGVRVGSAPLDPIDVMPGNHQFAADSRHTEVVVAAGTPTVVKLLDDAPVPPPTSDAVIAPVHSIEPEQPTPEKSYWTTGHIVGWTALGVGVASAVVSVVFGQKSNSAADRVGSLAAQGGPTSCSINPGGASCDQLNNARDDQSHAHTASLVFAGVGAAGLITAGVLLLPDLFRSDHRDRSVILAPTFSPNGGGLSIRGAL